MNLDSDLAMPADIASAAGMPVHWREDFGRLGPAFYTRLPPIPLPAPYWVARSDAVACLLGLDAAWFRSDEALEAFSGNRLLPGSDPLASVYSGHQFGIWAGQLGDGRALLLGETQNGQEIQLKGSGRTPYSRMGDGRAVLRSSIREFLCSEAMHALGIPTTRALCVTGSDAPVYREDVETAAVATRVATSFIRFGHFEHFEANRMWDALRALADHVIDRYFPECRFTPRFGGNCYAALLETVSERTAALLAHWQAVGFCHGVMNTDNMSILGLTIDYGPFQFLDGFDPGHICNHSDHHGRYAYNQQPSVAYWNLYCLGQALLPLIGDPETTVAALASYPSVFAREFEARMRAKLGLHGSADSDRLLITEILELLAVEKTDWTIFWRRLTHFVAEDRAQDMIDLFIDPFRINAWLASYKERLTGQDRTACAQLMRRTNPKFVLRNHLAQQAIVLAQRHDFSEVQRLLTLLSSPFDEQPAYEAYAGFPPDWAASLEIGCSS